MLQFILGLVLLVLGYLLLKKLLKLVLQAGAIALTLVSGILFGPAVAVAVGAERIGRNTGTRHPIGVCVGGVAALLAIAWGVLGLHGDLPAFSLSSLKFVLPAALFGCMIHYQRTASALEHESEPLALFGAQRTLFYRCLYAAFSMFLLAASASSITHLIGWADDYAWVFGIGYWLCAVLTQTYAIHQEVGKRKLLEELGKEFAAQDKVDGGLLLTKMKKQSDLDADDVELIFNGVAARLLRQDKLVEVELNESRWLFRASWYRRKLSALSVILANDVRHDEGKISKLVDSTLLLPPLEKQDFISRHLDFGEYHAFKDGDYFVSHSHVDRLRICTSCGLTELASASNDAEWFCSAVCEETESVCLAVKDKEPAIFLGEAAASGFILMAGAAAWNENHKMFAAGGQGHGFAAEAANHKVDRALGRGAKIVGGNNAKDGADRFVDGGFIQTKYCSSARSSVSQAFDGDQGLYRYVDESGTPMQLEVPKDQFDASVKLMAGKIKQGKVPGVTDPADAGKLVRRGHVTYDQAKNITKFGTVESVTYDLIEGAVVGSVAGGISFGVTSLIYYINTKDAGAAFRVAAVQGGKTFGRTLAVYVTAQQLHRLASVQRALSVVDASSLSPTVRDYLSRGMGLQSGGLTKALRGTIVTSVVVIAITTGPDLIKMVRGQISRAQFFKNLAVVSSGVAGGVIGSIAGGVVFSPLGPVGMIVGRTAGGIVGGMVASFIANKVANVLMEEDRVKMLRLIQVQMEYLAVSFMLTKDEIENLNVNLDQIVTPKTLEILHAATDNRRAMANFFIKPVVVSVVKQRPALSYQVGDVIDACEQLAA